jgi:hypothetical protein
MAAIDIGPPADNLNSYTAGGYTVVCVTNPANASGVIDTFQSYINQNATIFKVGVFSKSGNICTCRDFASIGAVSRGARTFSGLSIAVEEGDICGHYSNGNTEKTGEGGGTGAAQISGDKFDGSAIDFTGAWQPRDISLYGTGETVAAGAVPQMLACM